jgi:serine/threonine protein kinase
MEQEQVPSYLSFEKDCAIPSSADYASTARLKDSRFGLEKDARVFYKCYSIEKIGNPKSIWENEVDWLEKIDGSFAPKLYSSGIIDGYYYIVMEKIPGEDLLYYFDKKGKEMNFLEKLNLMIKICSLVEQFHNINGVHMDIKLENIIITPDEKLFLIDFGHSRPIEFKGCLPMVGFGTPNYSAPEFIFSVRMYGQSATYNQLRCPWVDSKSDVWSLGQVMFVVMTNQSLTHKNAKLCESILQKLGYYEISSLYQEMTHQHSSSRINLKRTILTLLQIRNTYIDK